MKLTYGLCAVCFVAILVVFAATDVPAKKKRLVLPNASVRSSSSSQCRIDSNGNKVCSESQINTSQAQVTKSKSVEFEKTVNRSTTRSKPSRRLFCRVRGRRCQ